MLVQLPIFSTTSANGSSPTKIKSLPSCGTICTTLMLLIWRKRTKQVISCQWYTCKNQGNHGQHYKKWLIPTKGLSTLWIPRLMYLLHHGNFSSSFHDDDDTNDAWISSYRIHDQYTYVFETPYDNKDANGFTCVIDRPQSPPNPQDMMYVMNHFLYGVIHVGREIEVPQLDKASVTNGMDSLSKHVDDCHRAFGRKPNFVEVDFYDHGKALEFVAMLNNISLDESTDTKHPGFPWPSNLPHINEIRSRLLPLPSVPHIVIENGSCSRSSLHHISLLCTTLLSIIFISFFWYHV